VLYVAKSTPTPVVIEVDDVIEVDTKEIMNEIRGGN